MQPADRNVVEMARLVVGIEIDGEARAYPVQFIGYHHQVRDTVSGTPVLVSVLHGVPDRSRLPSRRRRTPRVVPARRDGSLQRHVRGLDDRQLVASGERRSDRGTPEGQDARGDPEPAGDARAMARAPSAVAHHAARLRARLALCTGLRLRDRPQPQPAHRVRFGIVAREVLGRGHHGQQREQSLRLEPARARDGRERHARRHGRSCSRSPRIDGATSRSSAPTRRRSPCAATRSSRATTPGRSRDAAEPGSSSR